jgi:hypothetical protein
VSARRRRRGPLGPKSGSRRPAHHGVPRAASRVTGSAPCERAIRDRLFTFYDWCACHDDIPELASLARTIARWEDELIAATLTGVTNARSESLNRIAKLEARNAYSFRNPANQRRRVRTACTRGRSPRGPHDEPDELPGAFRLSPALSAARAAVLDRDAMFEHGLSLILDGMRAQLVAATHASG